MCNSQEHAFLWIGTILINSGFIALISWGATTTWVLGFILSALYSCSLFGMAVYLERKNCQIRNSEYVQVEDTETSAEGQEGTTEPTDQGEMQQEEVDDPEQGTTDINSAPKKIPLMISLLYGLAVVSVGVTGFFLPMNLVPYCNPSSGGDYPPHGEYKWVTNYTEMSSEVQDWARDDNNLIDMGPTFGYVPTTGITLFQGSNRVAYDDETVFLWTTQQDTTMGPPKPYKDLLYPNSFVQVSDNTVCFATVVPGQKQQQYHHETTFYKRSIYCSDGIKYRSMIVEPSEAAALSIQKHSIGALKSFEKTLWFKVDVSYDNDDSLIPIPVPIYDYSNIVIFSMDTVTMNTTLHSYKVKSDDTNDDCDENKYFKMGARIAFVTSALPITMLSMLIWYKKSIPTMGVTTYIGFTCIYFAIYFMVHTFDDDVYDYDPGFDWCWWFIISGGIYTLISSYALLSTTSQYYNVEPFQWGLIISSIVYVYNLMWITVMYSPGGNDTFWRWLILNLFGFGPIIILGLATNIVFMSLLGAIGLLIDAGRFAAFVGDHVNTQGAMPLVFLIFAASGLVVGILGYQLRKYQPCVQSSAQYFVQVINEYLIIFCCSEEPTVSNGERNNVPEDALLESS